MISLMKHKPIRINWTSSPRKCSRWKNNRLMIKKSNKPLIKMRLLAPTKKRKNLIISLYSKSFKINRRVWTLLYSFIKRIILQNCPRCLCLILKISVLYQKTKTKNLVLILNYQLPHYQEARVSILLGKMDLTKFNYAGHQMW